jgi:hypothetical protein
MMRGIWQLDTTAAFRASLVTGVLLRHCRNLPWHRSAHLIGPVTISVVTWDCWPHQAGGDRGSYRNWLASPAIAGRAQERFHNKGGLNKSGRLFVKSTAGKIRREAAFRDTATARKNSPEAA